MVDKGYDIQFKDGKCRILSGFGSMIASGTKTKGNIFHLDVGAKIYLISQDNFYSGYKGFTEVDKAY
jgi:hypothetical protein